MNRQLVLDLSLSVTINTFSTLISRGIPVLVMVMWHMRVSINNSFISIFLNSFNNLLMKK